MINLEYNVAGQLISATSVPQYLVADTVGIYRVVFTFDSDWSGLGEKTAVFRNPSVIDVELRDVPVEFPLDENNSALIPGAILDPGKLFIGVYGVNGTQQMPTIWAPPMQVVPGASPGVDAPDDPAIGTAVRTAPQTLTEAEQAQARENIGAIGGVEGDEGNVVVIGSNQNIIDGGFKATASFPVGSASGSIVTIEDGADGVPIKSMTVQIEPNQKATINDVSPTNICLINGWTSFNVNCGKKNLWGGAKLKEQLLTYVPSGVYDDENHTFDFSASASVVYNQKAGRIGFFWIPWKENTRYTFILTLKKTANAGLNLNAVYTDGTSVVIPGAATPGTKQTFVYTTPANKTLFYIGKRNSGGHTVLHLDECGVFEGVLTADDFEPYNGNTYEIEFPTEAGTVYGGTVTVNEDGSGTLTVDTVKHEFTGDETVNKYSTYFFIPLGDTNYGVLHDSEAICSHLPYAYISSSSLGVGFDVGNSSRNNKYNFFINGYESAGLDTTTHIKGFFKDQYENGTPVTVVFHLSNPATYQLTAEQVQTLLFSTLKGLNNIWADTGNISLEYHADPTIFVEEKTRTIKESIAYLQDDFTAIQPYVVNDLVYVGDTLYIVTSAIAQGATMTPNTNCAETTLNAVIKSLR